MKPQIVAFLMMFSCSTLLAAQIDPVAWEAPSSKGYTGSFATNNRLADLKYIDLKGRSGPEDVVLGNDGYLYGATHDSAIIRIDIKTGTTETLASTGGRPLGLAFGPDGLLYIADAFLGLMVLTEKNEVELLADKTASGSPILYANNLDITKTGVIYFTDSSTRFGAAASGDTLAASMLDLMEHQTTGRVLKYDPASKTVDVVTDGFNFANGIALSEDEQYLLVIETGAYTVHRIWLDGQKQGQREAVLTNMPGFPDNLTRASGNTFWLGLVSPRSTAIDKLSGCPSLRKIVQMLPEILRPKPQRYAHIVHIDGDGQVLETLQDAEGRYAMNTGAISGPNGELIITSLTEPRLGYLEAGWDKK
ncbi:SMP-30/gluconolactonase/LRE family protein [Endozoicomonas ascidiicola]|uniref:SMP-30/gluconolactonase/LRE family protein n=1 Tax=Endozoicomonas ascidiicola TaxID=1698521 RepID=UPI00083552F9|nr:SMP-30/gluconolactonase/LRE family protein [Endozoicomonas ascidiicola]